MKFLDSEGLNLFWTRIKAVFQEKLVSGTNIKTVNGQTLLGSGDITIETNGTTTGDYLPLTGGTLTDTFTVKTDNDGIVIRPADADTEELLTLKSAGISAYAYRSEVYDDSTTSIPFFAANGTVQIIESIGSDTIAALS